MLYSQHFFLIQRHLNVFYHSCKMLYIYILYMYIDNIIWFKTKFGLENDFTHALYFLDKIVYVNGCSVVLMNILKSMCMLSLYYCALNWDRVSISKSGKQKNFGCTCHLSVPNCGNMCSVDWKAKRYAWKYFKSLLQMSGRTQNI